jgi:2-oxoglutarate dehydrogenase E2 component (dihydrolipoamide succinyltransferase)
MMGDSITEGTITSWVKNVGEVVNEDETFVTIETDKVSVDVSATGFSGVLTAQLAKAGETVKVAAPLAEFELGAGAVKKAEAAAPPKEEPKVEAPKPAAPKQEAAPAPKQEAAPAPKKESAPKPAAPSAPPKPAAGTRGQTRVKMTRIRMRIAERLVQAQSTGALLTTFNEVDMTQLMEMRNLHKDAFEKAFGVKLGFMSAFVVACTKALQEIPAVNAYIEGDEIVYNDYVDISVAVSAPRGLVVPVLRNCETMSFADVEKGIGALAKKARDDALTLEEMAGGTFTITNGGVFGSLMSTPMINSPQSAILGMHAIKQRPVVLENGQIAARPMMYVALTYDHRLIDGRESVTFLKSVKEKLEDPKRMLLGL